MKRKIIIYSFLISVVVILALILLAYIQTLRAPIIDDPVSFTKNFNQTNEQSVELGTRKGMSIIGDEIYFYKSPLFPYVTIEDWVVVSYCSPDYRQIHFDSLWDVFWIRISGCDLKDQNNEKIFGPYRTNQDLYDIKLP